MSVKSYRNNAGVLEPIISEGFTSNNHENLSNLSYPAGHTGFSDTKIRNLPDTYSISATPSTPGTGYVINDICSAQAGTRYFTYTITEVGDAGEIISGILSPTILAESVTGMVTLNGGSGTGGMITLASSAAQQHTQEIKFSDTLNQMDSSKNETAIPTYTTDAAGNLQFGKTAETDLIAGLARTDLANVANTDFADKADVAGVSGRWGSIQGTIDDQTDLINKFTEKITDTGNIALVNNTDSGKVFSDILSSQSTENEYVSAKIIYDYIIEHALNSNDYQGLFTYFGERTAVEAQISAAGDKAISFEGSIGAVTNVIRGDYNGSTWTWATAVPQAKNAMWIFAHKLLNETNTPFGMAIYNDDQSNPANFGTVAFPMFTPDDIDIEINGNGQLAFTASANNRINSKEPAIAPGSAGQFFSGDKTFKALTASDVPALPYVKPGEAVEQVVLPRLLMSGSRWDKVIEFSNVGNNLSALLYINGTGALYNTYPIGIDIISTKNISQGGLKAYRLINQNTANTEYGYTVNSSNMFEVWIKTIGSAHSETKVFNASGRDSEVIFGLLATQTTEPAGIVYVTPELLPGYAQTNNTISRLTISPDSVDLKPNWYRIYQITTADSITGAQFLVSGTGTRDRDMIGLCALTLSGLTDSKTLKATNIIPPTAVNMQYGYIVNTDSGNTELWIKTNDRCSGAYVIALSNNSGSENMVLGGFPAQTTEPAGIVYVTPQKIDAGSADVVNLTNEGTINNSANWDDIVNAMPEGKSQSFTMILATNNIILSNGTLPGGAGYTYTVTAFKINGIIFATAILNWAGSSAFGEVGRMYTMRSDLVPWQRTDLFQPSPVETITTAVQWDAVMNKIPARSFYEFVGVPGAGVLTGINTPVANQFYIFRVNKGDDNAEILAEALLYHDTGSDFKTYRSSIGNGRTGWDIVGGDPKYIPTPAETIATTSDWDSMAGKIPVYSEYRFIINSLPSGLLDGSATPPAGSRVLFTLTRVSNNNYVSEAIDTTALNPGKYMSAVSQYGRTEWRKIWPSA